MADQLSQSAATTGALAVDVTAYLAVHMNYPVTPATIRQWAKRGLIIRISYDRLGRARYDLQSVVDHVQRVAA